MVTNGADRCQRVFPRSGSVTHGNGLGCGRVGSSPVLLARQVHMAVVVQQMVFPEAAGILFTADPVRRRPLAARRATAACDDSGLEPKFDKLVFELRHG